jgi:2-succinyl-5-enolpyruvyl-6-hydroxy-3-cyclohexene-1-carboxylate synthase
LTTNKLNIQLLTHLLQLYGIKDVVSSPGSRNAPLSIGFNRNSAFNCYTIPDERSAAFFALGIIQATDKPVVIHCTSGSAVLNYAPAIAEAYYQKLPLIIITADRPKNLISVGDGQTIRQENVYQNYIKNSYVLTEENEPDFSVENSQKIIEKAIQNCTDKISGPVHINIPFSEPLYELSELDKSISTITLNKENKNTGYQLDINLKKLFNSSKKKLVIVGQLPQNHKLENTLKKLSTHPSITILTESTSNVSDPNFIPCIDRTISAISDTKNFVPDLLITLGNNIISKKIKQLFRENKPAHHWHIGHEYEPMNTFFSLTESIEADPKEVLIELEQNAEPLESNYNTLWKGLSLNNKEKHTDFLKTAAFSDLKAFEIVLDSIPENSVLQMGNSSVVRYIQLFEPLSNINYLSNRGVSGIDGSTSTSVGFANKTNKTVTCITGDLSFIYDSNAFWNNYLTSNLKIIIINNGGGGIFKIIDGPNEVEELEKYFVAKQNINIQSFCKTFQLNYLFANDATSLEDKLVELYHPSGENFEPPTVLEVDTKKIDNHIILKDYFRHLKTK